MGAHLERGLILVEQSRHELAEKELRQELAGNPESPVAHAMLALCLAKREQYKEATEEAQAAIHHAPDVPLGHYALASVMHDRNRLDEARKAIEEAIRLDPEDADYFALLAGIHLDDRQWPAALKAAEQGLALDAEHVGSANLRAMALVKLGRKKEAGLTIDATLAKSPEDALTHANQGWTLLEKGDHRKALEHFREALRLEPQLEWARLGIVEALKARHFAYGLILRYFLWMAKLSGKAQWAVIVGAYVGNQALRGVARETPQFAPWIWPLIIVYMLFAYLTWTAAPLFNLLLRLDRFGRLVLSREEILASNLVGGCLLGAILSTAVWLTLGSSVAMIGALVFLAIVIPLSATFQCDPGYPRKVMSIFTIALAAVALIALGLLLMDSEAAVALSVLFFLGVFISGWVANGLAMSRPKK